MIYVKFQVVFNDFATFSIEYTYDFYVFEYWSAWERESGRRNIGKREVRQNFKEEENLKGYRPPAQ